MLKYYGNKSNGKLVHVKKMYGTKEDIIHFGYDDFLGRNQYNIQQYFVLRRKENDEYVFCKTVSEGKARALTVVSDEQPALYNNEYFERNGPNLNKIDPTQYPNLFKRFYNNNRT